MIPSLYVSIAAFPSTISRRSVVDALMKITLNNVSQAVNILIWTSCTIFLHPD